jgi:hypothetical protein
MFHPSKYIHLPLFVFSFLLGLLAVYIMGDGATRKIYVYPTPENVAFFQYRDDNQTCYEAAPTEVTCPSDRSQLAKNHIL